MQTLVSNLAATRFLCIDRIDHSAEICPNHLGCQSTFSSRQYFKGPPLCETSTSPHQAGRRLADVCRWKNRDLQLQHPNISWFNTCRANPDQPHPPKKPTSRVIFQHRNGLVAKNQCVWQVKPRRCWTTIQDRHREFLPRWSKRFGLLWFWLMVSLKNCPFLVDPPFETSYFLTEWQKKITIQFLLYNPQHATSNPNTHLHNLCIQMLYI